MAGCPISNTTQVGKIDRSKTKALAVVANSSTDRSINQTVAARACRIGACDLRARWPCSCGGAPASWRSPWRSCWRPRAAASAGAFRPAGCSTRAPSCRRRRQHRTPQLLVSPSLLCLSSSSYTDARRLMKSLAFAFDCSSVPFPPADLPPLPAALPT